jgi:hypothetical protein
MNLMRLIQVRLTALLRSFFSLIFLILAAIIGFTAAYLTEEKNPDILNVALVLEDTGSYSQRFVASLQQENWLEVSLMDREAALKLLRQDRMDAVLVVRPGYSSTLEQGQFANILELYTTPSSNAALTLSEPVINKTWMLWVEESALANVESYLSGQHTALSDAEQAAFRADLIELWHQGYGIEVTSEYLQQPAVPPEAADSFAAAVQWYAIFCLFYLMISASWVLDINNSQLKMRASQKGVPVWQMTFVSALAPFILALLSYLVMGSAVCAVFGNPFFDLLRFLLPVILYLLGALGIMLAVTCTLNSLTILLFLAPVTTFFVSVLSGMIAPLPQWAYMLTAIAKTLPGSWLSASAASGQSHALAALALCASLWLLCGAGASLLREKLVKRNT